jgi:hypothetical protein
MPFEGNEVARTNARLIAAAPEMLEALSNIMCAHIGANIAEATTPELRHACHAARAAIAKAKGTIQCP